MGNKTKALVLCIVCQYDEIRSCMVFCISLYIPMQIHLTNIRKFIGIYFIDEISIDKNTYVMERFSA